MGINGLLKLSYFTRNRRTMMRLNNFTNQTIAIFLQPEVQEVTKYCFYVVLPRFYNGTWGYLLTLNQINPISQAQVHLYT